MKGIQKSILPSDNLHEIALLIGRDLLEAFRVSEYRYGLENEPYALHMKLGWVIVGGTNSDKEDNENDSSEVIVRKTLVTPSTVHEQLHDSHKEYAVCDNLLSTEQSCVQQHKSTSSSSSCTTEHDKELRHANPQLIVMDNFEGETASYETSVNSNTEPTELSDLENQTHTMEQKSNEVQHVSLDPKH